jgi:hypothetical protein
MLILIHLDRREPPAGMISLPSPIGESRSEAEPRLVPFVGWLGMLRALSDVLAASEAGSRES